MMKSIPSLETKREIREKINNKLHDKEFLYSLHHAIARANILNFFPSNLSNEDLDHFLMDCYYYKGGSLADLDDFSLIDDYVIHTPDNITDTEVYKTQPTIFATFHMGSYRIIHNYLNSKNFREVLIVDTEVYENQTEHYMDVYTSIQKERGTTGELLVLNADEQSTFFKLKQLIKEGYSLVVYLDGNMGAGSRNVTENKNLLPISFFGKEIYVRKGVGVLAKLLGAQIVPVISHIENEQIHLTFYPEYNVSSIDQVSGAISYCYRLLEKQLTQQPAQWECWLYMNNWINYDKIIEQMEYNSKIIPNKNGFHFNKNKYNLVHDELDTSYFLFENSTYSAYEISKNDFTILSSKIIPKSSFPLEVESELIEREVLI